MNDFNKRPLAITDIETTGLDAQRHEIIDLGLLLVEQANFKILDRFEVKIKPTNLKEAAKKALTSVGYSDKEWKKAWELEQAIQIFSEKTKGAVFLSQNSYFEWSFLEQAFRRTGVEDLMDYHRLDLFSIAWAVRKNFPGMSKFSLTSLGKYFSLPTEPLPHRASSGAKQQLAVLRCLTKLS